MSATTGLVCLICHYEVELDDAVVPTGGRCICLRCFLRETGTEVVMPAPLRKEWIRVIEGIE